MSEINKMLIDASHPEETRVVVLRNGRVEEFDYESAARKLLRGNIYLAKVTRVEPALQAAFIDYGGNRHGFLAFGEIHPDYYQIPIADRLALIEEEAAYEAEEEAEAEARAEKLAKRKSRSRSGSRRRSGRNGSRGKGSEDRNASSNDNGDEADDELPEVELDLQDDAADTSENNQDEAGHDVSSADEDSVRAEAGADHSGDAQVGSAEAGEQPAAAESAPETATETDPGDESQSVTVEYGDSGTGENTGSNDQGSDGDDGSRSDPTTLAQAMAADPKLTEEFAGEDTNASQADEPVMTDPSATSEGSSASDETGDEIETAGEPIASRSPAHGDEPPVDEPHGSDDGSGDNDSGDDDDDNGEDDNGDYDDDNGDDDVENGDDDEDDDEGEDENGDAPEEVITDEADALEELPTRPRRTRRSYKIQEVIKRRQVLLIQVVKEERGNKGAALTTYLSLAGRYTVLMPNTARGGGISRKITNPQDRKRLKAIASELEVPEGMGLIIRTAGAARTKQEIRRDYEYLLRLWESVRELTLNSTAPSLVYEEGNLIKRSIRDLYNKEIDEIVVSGDQAHREAKDFMRMLMPSHAKNVIAYKDPEPLFAKYQIERQLNQMFSPHVPLKSGGYLIINQTEALVAVDVNSGRSTREFSIEETALHTNLEAADELSRQLKLRDLAGLIVIDFIDMEEKRNNRAVERRLKEALAHDRARIQVGRISHFGLLEMSRQRMRTGVLEGSTTPCPHCQGTGIIRSTESIALAVLRGLEDAIMSRQKPCPLRAVTTTEVALYVLNNKRHFITSMEDRYGWQIAVESSPEMAGANFNVERLTQSVLPARRKSERSAVNMDWGFDEEADDDNSRETGSGQGQEARTEGDEEGGRKRRRRRRRGRRDDGADTQHQSSRPQQDDDDEDDYESGTEKDIESGISEHTASDGQDDADGDDENGRTRRRGRRRGRRGGRRNRERLANQTSEDGSSQGEAQGDEGTGRDTSETIPGTGPQPSISASVIEITTGGHAASATPGDDAASDESAEIEIEIEDDDQDEASDGKPRYQSSSSRRGGRGRNRGRSTDDSGKGSEDRTVKERSATASNDPGREEAEADAAHAGNTEPPPAPTADEEPDHSPDTDESGDEETTGAPRGDQPAGTPRIETVTVGPGATSDATPDSAQPDSPEHAEETSDDAKSSRKGWWQRRILG